MSENLKSQVITQGVQRSPNRAMLRAVGLPTVPLHPVTWGLIN
jgi:dihydroxy-acid dehydratase